MDLPVQHHQFHTDALNDHRFKMELFFKMDLPRHLHHCPYLKHLRSHFSNQLMPFHKLLLPPRDIKAFRQFMQQDVD